MIKDSKMISLISRIFDCKREIKKPRRKAWIMMLSAFCFLSMQVSYADNFSSSIDEISAYFDQLTANYDQKIVYEFDIPNITIPNITQGSGAFDELDMPNIDQGNGIQ